MANHQPLSDASQIYRKLPEVVGTTKFLGAWDNKGRGSAIYIIAIPLLCC